MKKITILLFSAFCLMNVKPSFSATDFGRRPVNKFIPGCTNNPFNAKSPKLMGLENVLLYVEVDSRIPKGEILSPKFKSEALIERAINALKYGALKCIQSEHANKTEVKPIIITDINDSRILDDKNLTVVIRVLYFSKLNYPDGGPLIMIGAKAIRSNKKFLVEGLIGPMSWQPIFPDMTESQIDSVINNALSILAN